MHPSYNIYYLYYSDLLLFPYLRTLLYILQLVLLKMEWSHIVILSYDNNRWQKRLISLIPIHSRLYCRSTRLGRVLSQFKQKIIFDIYPIDFTRLTTAALYDLMWTLVYCEAVTAQARIALANFIWDDFPIEN